MSKLEIAGAAAALLLAASLVSCTPPQPNATPAANVSPPAAATTAAGQASAPSSGLQPPVGAGQETTPVGAANPAAVTQAETEIVPNGPPAALNGAALIDTAHLVRAMTNRDAGRASFWLIDTRGCAGQASIPTSVCFSVGGIDAIKAAVPDKTTGLVFFCQDGGCPTAFQMASQALEAGYANVAWYRGGMGAWSAAGLPSAAGPQAVNAPAYH